MKYTPPKIETLKENQIFVFGSNLAGRHGKGAALKATRDFGARYGCAEGLTGQCYAIPTKDRNLQTLDKKDIRNYVGDFLQFATLNHDLEFLVTEIGCGLAGYEPRDIAPMFIGSPINVILPESFMNSLELLR